MEFRFHASHAIFYLAAALGAGVIYVSAACSPLSQIPRAGSKER